MPAPILCREPGCRQPMHHVAGGLWACPNGHQRRPSYLQVCEAQGLFAIPIGRAPLGNIGDGTRCLLLGAVEPGSGSKSGRRRKKPRRGGKTYVNEEWQAS